MAIKFKEQQALIKEGANFLSEGNSVEAWRAKLTQRGFYPYDIDRLGFDIEKELGDRAVGTIQPELEATSEAVNHYGLSDDVFDRVVQQQEAHFRKLRDARVRLLARQGLSPDEIMAEVKHTLYDADDVSHVLSKEQARQEFNEVEGGIMGSTGPKASFVGIILVVIGVALSAFMSTSGGTVIFYGLILVGVFMVIKGMSGD